DRVRPRPLNWRYQHDYIGGRLTNLYKKLSKIRKDHPALTSPFFYPDYYDERDTHFNSQGYGVDVDKDVIIYHRWGIGKDGKLEKFIIVLNCSHFDQYVNIPFSNNGRWRDLLNDQDVQVEGYWLTQEKINSNWGKIYYFQA
ncbi:MAG TPA: alpha amylase C-terminal domain-containing protein, partial [Nostocaceae cyanobacterium]|nr:alpha amylase C-terminal domain-containing protein [Nostocaceae cyanobacterium]